MGSIKSGRYRVFACSSGTSTCRPMTMKRNKKGYWKVDSISSLSTGCSKPASDEPTAADEL